MSLTYLKDRTRIPHWAAWSNGTLGKRVCSNYTIELKEDAKPYHTKSFSYTNHLRTILQD